MQIAERTNDGNDVNYLFSHCVHLGNGTVTMEGNVKHVRKKLSPQFEAHNKYYPDYNKHTGYSEMAKKVKQVPKVVEFGKSLSIPGAMLTQDGAVQIAYESLLKDFFQIKAENFPTWPGLPEIKVNPVNGLKQEFNVAWYAVVPKEFVIDKDQKLEEDLWNS